MFSADIKVKGVAAGVLILIVFVCWTNFTYMETRKDALPTSPSNVQPAAGDRYRPQA